MSQETLYLIERIRLGIGRARSRLVRVALLKGFVLSLAAMVALWTLFATIEAIVWAPASFRTVLFAVIVGSVAIMLVWWIIRPLLRSIGLLPGMHDMDVARLVGRRDARVGDSLVNLLQLSSGSHSESPSVFVDEAVKRLALPMENASFEQVADFKSVAPTAKWSLIPIAVFLIVLLAAPGAMWSASERLLNPGTEFVRPAPFSLLVTPGDAERISGGSLDVSVQASGNAIGIKPVIESLVVGEVRSRTRDLVPGADGNWTVRFEDIREPFRYRVAASGISTGWYDVKVVNRPIVQQLQLELISPAYTRIPPRTLDVNVGDVTAVSGTEVRPRVRVSGAGISSAHIVFESGDSLSMNVTAGTASTAFRVSARNTYRIRLTSDEGISNADPIPYRITPIQDASPTVSLLQPEPLSNLNDERTAFVLLHMTDDFGFRRVTLYWRLAESRFGTIEETFSSLQIPLQEPYLLDQELGFDWVIPEMTALSPVPGDVIEYYMEVQDNDSVSGFKRSQSRVHRLRMPSITEKYEAIDAREDDTEESLEELMEAARKARDDFEELKRNLLEKPEAEWQEKRALEQLQEQQKEMENALDAVTRKMEELADEMSQNDMVSDETLNTFKELQEVVEEVRTPDLMDALRQMEESIEQMNPNQMQDAMENFEFSEQLYQERLERTLNLFKNFRVQQDLEEVERRSEDLARTEEKLAEETGQMPEKAQDTNQQEQAENLAEQQEQAAEEMQALEEKMEEIRKRMEELKNQPSEEMQDLLEDTQDKNIPQKMKENAEQVREGNKNKAQQQQQEMSEQLDQLSGDLSNLQMQAAGAQIQLNMAGIRAALEDVLTLSANQEQLRVEVDGYAVDSPLLRDAAQQQSRQAEGLTVVADSLQRIAREVPQMSRAIQEETGNALRQMSEATAALTERAARRAVNNQRASMTHMNELALLLSDLLNQMNNASGAGQSNMSMEQMMEQLQNMGQQQQQLNQQIQQLLNDMQGNRLTQDMTERLRQMGAQQEQIRQQLRELSRNRELRNKALGDLNRIAEQMQESIQELQGARANRETVERQQEILTRLLEASRSLEQRGRENKREGKSAEEIMRDSPAELSPSEQMERLRRDLIRALESGYADDYQSLIRKYFELLQREGAESIN